MSMFGNLLEERTGMCRTPNDMTRAQGRAREGHKFFVYFHISLQLNKVF